jgi:monofunctional biosynthetic peptidoglycan transglycosylase
LAAVLPNPLLFHANAPSRYVQMRQQWILRQMRQMGSEDYLREHRLY